MGVVQMHKNQREKQTTGIRNYHISWIRQIWYQYFVFWCKWWWLVKLSKKYDYWECMTFGRYVSTFKYNHIFPITLLIVFFRGSWLSLQSLYEVFLKMKKIWVYFLGKKTNITEEVKFLLKGILKGQLFIPSSWINLRI